MTLTVPAPQTIHPFPARMAPDLVFSALQGLKPGSVVLDPMMGSGSFPLAAARAGHIAMGIDSDPLAVLIASTSRCNWKAEHVVRSAGEVRDHASMPVRSRWSHPDVETDRFIDYWFDAEAKVQLAGLAEGIKLQPPEVQDPLWVAFSRLIITKDAGASRARDVSHSRPHVVRDGASFDPRARFVRSVNTVLERAAKYGPPATGGRIGVIRGDARALPIESDSIDLLVTSPPYLTAIDYLRGHRLSLVWMGYTVGGLRVLRGSNIGSERSLKTTATEVAALQSMLTGTLPQRAQGVLSRYVADVSALMNEIVRVLKPNAEATFVVADASVHGVAVDISRLTQSAAEVYGLELVRKTLRDLPDNRRYLPMPATSSGSSLSKRMRVESVITMRRTS